MFQDIPWMPSLARVMPAISVFMMSLPSRLLFGRRAVLGVAVAVIGKHLLDDLGLELAVGTLGDLGQIKILDRIAVDVELEIAAQRSEVGLLQRRRHRVLVAEVALQSFHRAVDQHGWI